MKTVFFSTDITEVEQVCKKLTDRSIPCEIRTGLAGGPAAIELCVQRDEDLPRAFMECVRDGIGLAKRKVQSVGKNPRQLFVTVCAELSAPQAGGRPAPELGEAII